MQVLNIPFIAVGAALGSFANMYAFRFSPDSKNKTSSIRSICDFCHQTLSWRDNIPVVSFLILRGRSRCCGRRLPLRYLIVELLGLWLGFLAGQVWLRLTDSVPNPYHLFISLSLIVIVLGLSLMITAYDLAYYIIPIRPALAWWLIGAVWLVVFIPTDQWLMGLTASFGAGLFLAGLYLVTKGRGMGLGDAVLVLVFGAFLSWPAAIAAVWLSFVTGALVGVVLVAFRKTKKGFKSLIPLGPFLVQAFWLSWAFQWWRMLIQ